MPEKAVIYVSEVMYLSEEAQRCCDAACKGESGDHGCLFRLPVLEVAVSGLAVDTVVVKWQHYYHFKQSWMVLQYR